MHVEILIGKAATMSIAGKFTEIGRLRQATELLGVGAGDGVQLAPQALGRVCLLPGRVLQVARCGGGRGAAALPQRGTGPGVVGVAGELPEPCFPLSAARGRFPLDNTG